MQPISIEIMKKNTNLVVLMSVFSILKKLESTSTQGFEIPSL